MPACRDPQDAFDAFAAAGGWTTGTRVARAGRARRAGCAATAYPTLPASTAAWAEPLYRILFDPDGRAGPCAEPASTDLGRLLVLKGRRLRLAHADEAELSPDPAMSMPNSVLSA